MYPFFPFPGAPFASAGWVSASPEAVSLAGWFRVDLREADGVLAACAAPDMLPACAAFLLPVRVLAMVVVVVVVVVGVGLLLVVGCRLCCCRGVDRGWWQQGKVAPAWRPKRTCSHVHGAGPKRELSRRQHIISS